MKLVTTTEMLKKAQHYKYAVPAFNIENLEMCQAVIQAAEEFKSPVIIQTSKNTLKYASPDVYYAMVKACASAKSVPVALHLDHGDSLNLVCDCLKAKFSSVMIDGSKLSFSDNVKITSDVCKVCHVFDIPVEGELGAIGGKVGDDNLDLNYTNPDIAKDFVAKTNVDSLAVAIGTAHGVYLTKPILDINRLKKIKEAVDVPLVLHGASGLTSKQIADCTKNGITKVNYATELRQAYTKAVRKFLSANSKDYDPKKFGLCAMQAVKQVAKEKMIDCNSVCRAINFAPEVVVWDFDGTIVDSEKINLDFWIKAAKNLNYNLTYEMALQLRSLDKTLATELFFNWFKDYSSYNKIRELRKTFTAKWQTTNSYQLKKNIKTTLKTLKLLGVKNVIVSASSKEYINAILKQLKIDQYFDKIISVSDVKRGKPYPDVYLYASKELNVDVKNMLVIEDSPNGVKSAKSAGCNVIMIPDLTEPDNQLILLSDMVLPNAKYILNIFDR